MDTLSYKKIRLASTLHRDEVESSEDESFNPDRRVVLDRRAVNSERRGDYNLDHHGPFRRDTIDRRQNLKDRRK